MFDFNDYPLSSKFFDSVNIKVIANMKGEFKGKIISGFIRLKLHSLIAVDSVEIEKAN